MMPASGPQPADGLLMAEKLVRAVASSDHNSTYKMAAAIGVLQTAQETPPETSPSRLAVWRVAEVVVDLYLRQLRVAGDDSVLRQMNRMDQSSRLMSAVATLIQPTAADRSGDGVALSSVVREVQATLLAYPLRLLQPVDDQFMFDVPHPQKRSRAAFGEGFDGQLVLRPGVLPLLQRMAPLVRPLIEAAWVEKVARYNGVALDETRLRRQLFGYDRLSWPAGLRRQLESIQDGCFYCGDPLPRRTATESVGPERRATHIDHFIPWAATMNDAIENLVLTDGRCNLRKSDHLPTPAIVARWLDRLEHHAPELCDAAQATGWPSALARTLRTAAVQYERFGVDDVTPAWDGSAVIVTEVRSAGDLIRTRSRVLSVP
jgi:hypothetical protein